MNDLIAGWSELRAAIEREADSAPGQRLDAVKLRAPNPAPTHLLAAGNNYRSHMEEMRKQGFDVTGVLQSPEQIGFFLKPTGSISGPNDPIELPLREFGGRRFDYEGEIAFVIGKEARAVSPAKALDYVFGYTMMVDATLRMAPPERQELAPYRKGFASFSPMGPFITTADEFPDLDILNVKLWCNGELRQEAAPANFIVDIPHLLAQASRSFPLQPGDVYSTGSPPGVGPIKPGDLIELEGCRIGRMRLPVTERSW